jgi:DNA-binding FadR family transcriptional regulator
MRMQIEAIGARLTGDAEQDLRMLLERISGSGPLDVQSARLMIEPYAAATAASNATSADLDAIRETHEAAAAATAMDAFERLDGEFHKRIFAATRNDLLACVHDILNVIRGQSAWVDIKRRSFTEERRLSYCDDHGRIVEALSRRDAAAAAEAMRAHLTGISRNLFGTGS